MTAIAVTIAGSDSSGGAGIQADLKTFSALGVYGASAITALTAQNTMGVQAIHDVPTEFIRSQIDAIFDDLAVDAAKIGMLSQADTIRTVAEALDVHRPPVIVLDPVMVAATGALLLAPDAVEELRSTLVPRATIVTPNLHEAAKLTNTDIAENADDMRRQAALVLALGAPAVLIKGGHGTGPQSSDLFATAQSHRWFSSPRIATTNTHGTGCTLSSAIAAECAKGAMLEAAVDHAKAFIGKAIAGSDALSVGKGHGPVHHFHEFWPAKRSRGQ